MNKKFTTASVQVRVFEYYISIPKKFCHRDKNKQNYLIGIIPNYIYNCYDANKNWLEKIHGSELIKKYNLKSFHFLTVGNQRFKNMQQTNPFLRQFKNAQESMKWHQKQVAKEREQLKMLLSSRKKNSNREAQEDNNTKFVLNLKMVIFQLLIRYFYNQNIELPISKKIILKICFTDIIFRARSGNLSILIIN